MYPQQLFSILSLGFVQIVEPSYYYRIHKHFRKDVPEPYILEYQLPSTDVSSVWPGGTRERTTPFHELLERLDAVNNHPRVVLDIVRPPSSQGRRIPSDPSETTSRTRMKTVPTNIQAWANSSIGDWGPSPVDKSTYAVAPFIPKRLSRKLEMLKVSLDKYLLLCASFLIRPAGNRTCFDKCM